MSSDRDVTRIVRSWLEEGVTSLPDRVLDQVLDQLPTTPQRRAWWPARRLIEMNNVARLAIAAAAVVVIAFLGIRFLVPGSNSVGGPGATPTPTAVATPTPTPAATPTLSPGAAVPLPSGGGAVLPGRYLIDVPDSPVSLELTVADAGWSANGWYLGGGSTSISFWTVANVYANACVDSSSPEPPIGPTVDDLVAALDAQVGTDMQSFFNPDVGGYPATRVIMLPTEGVDCLGDLKLWESPGGPGRAIATTPSPGGEQDVVWIVDVDGNRVVIVGYYDPSDGAQIKRVLDVIDSIEFVRP